MFNVKAEKEPFGIYGIVKDPVVAVFSIFGTLIGVRGEIGFTRAAESRIQHVGDGNFCAWKLLLRGPWKMSK